MTAQRIADGRLPVSEKLAYAAPGFPLGALNLFTVTVLPTYYAEHSSVSLAEIGYVLLATRIFDAVFHPLVGFLSDVCVQRAGRKPWVVTGGILCPIAVYYLFDPASTAQAGYFALWLVLMFAARTILEIPLRAWGAELSRLPAERSAIFARLAQSGLIGTLLFLGAPLLPAFSGAEITSPRFLHWTAVAMAAALPLSTLCAAAGTRRGIKIATERSTITGLIRSVARNRPFRVFAAVFALSGIASGLYNSVLLLYVGNYLDIGKDYPIFGMLYFLVALVAVSGWSLTMNRLGKRAAWAIGLGALAVTLPLYWLVTPGRLAFPLLISFTVMFALGASASYLIPQAMIGDIVDYDILKSKVNRSGNYYALLQLIQTFEGAVGAGLGFILLGAFGYHAAGADSDFANTGLKLTLFVLPALLYAVSMAVILRFPITARRQEIIRRRLAQRARHLDPEPA